VDKINFNKEFEEFINIARKRITSKRSRKNMYLLQYNYRHSSNNKAMFIVRRGIHYIELYKPSIIDHYKKYYPSEIPFKLYLTSIIIHEMVHREQCIKEFKNNFNHFKTMYECYPDKYEEPARNKEKHFIEYILRKKFI
jgi:hypothetical protein